MDFLSVLLVFPLNNKARLGVRPNGLFYKLNRTPESSVFETVEKL